MFVWWLVLFTNFNLFLFINIFTSKCNVPIPVSVGSKTGWSGIRSGFSPKSIWLSGVLVTIRICARQNVEVEVVEIVGSIFLDQLSHDVSSHSRSYPFSCMNSYIKNNRNSKELTRMKGTSVLFNNTRILL